MHGRVECAPELLDYATSQTFLYQLYLEVGQVCCTINSKQLKIEGGAIASRPMLCAAFFQYSKRVTD